MSLDIALDLERADSLLQNEVDMTAQGVISFFDRTSNFMIINRDYYSQRGALKYYYSKQTIHDLFSSLHWNLYEKIKDITCIATVRSPYATIWAQMGESIPPLGILHIEHFYGAIPCTPEIKEGADIPICYEDDLAETIRYALGNKTVVEMPAILLKSFGTVVFGFSPEDVVHTAAILEKVAKLAWQMRLVQGEELQYLDYATMNRFHSLYCGERTSYMQRIDNK